jgi:ERCC4-related helicase
VLTNLRISKIEHRCETDVDVAKYVHGRTIEKIVVKPTKEITAIKDLYLSLFDTPAGRLRALKVLTYADAKSMTHYWVIQQKKQFESKPPSHVNKDMMWRIADDFMTLADLCQGLNHINTQGVVTFSAFLQEKLVK